MDKLVTLGLAERIKSSDFVIESKIVELSYNKNFRQSD